MIQRPRNEFASYHAHVYFDENSVGQARALCEEAATLFGVTMGRVHQKPVGPHPHWSCQFDALIPWLEAHRAGLNILVHGRTSNGLVDHTANASWLGEPSKLNLSIFEGS